MNEESYVVVRAPIEAGAVRRTIEIRANDLFVDVGQRSQILGVERLSGPVDFGDLFSILADDRIYVLQGKS